MNSFTLRQLLLVSAICMLVGICGLVSQLTVPFSDNVGTEGDHNRMPQEWSLDCGPPDHSSRTSRSSDNTDNANPSAESRVKRSETVETWIRESRDSNAIIRRRAIEALADSYSGREDARRAVRQALDDEERIVRDASGLALFVMAPCSPSTLAGLVQSVQSTDPSIQISAEWYLENYFEVCPSAQQHLLGYVADSNPRVRRAVLHALSKMPKSKVNSDLLDAVILAASDHDPSVRRTAVRMAGQWQNFDLRMLAIAGRLIHDVDPAVRIAAIKSIGCCGKAALPLVRQLVGMLSTTDDDELLATIYALSRIDSGNADARKSLEPILAHSNPEFRRWTGYALDREYCRALGYYVTSEKGGIAFVSRQYKYVIGIRKVVTEKQSSQIHFGLFGQFDWDNLWRLSVSDDRDPPQEIIVNVESGLDHLSVSAIPSVVTIDNLRGRVIASVTMNYLGQSITLRPDDDILRDRYIDFSLDLDSHCECCR